MTTRERAQALFDAYLARHAATDLEALLALFESDATVEDPVGSPIRRGLDAIREFYATTHARNGTLSIERVGPTLQGGSELAAHVRAGLDRAGSPPPMDVMYTIRVSPSSKIAQLRAWY